MIERTMAAATPMLRLPPPAQIAQAVAKIAPADLSKSPLLGILGVIIGAGTVTLTGRMITLGLPDYTGHQGFGFDESAWIGTAFNMALMFIGPFTVYLGALIEPRRILLTAAGAFTAVLISLPFIHNYSLVIAAVVFAGLTSGTFYPLTLTFALRNIPLRFLPYDCPVRHVRRRRSKHRADALRLVQRPSFLALDVLEFCGGHALNDVLYLLRNTGNPGTETIVRNAQFCGFSLCQRRVRDAAWRFRTRGKAGLVALRRLHRTVRRRFFLTLVRIGEATAQPQSPG